jgi:hypothetical protein
VKGFFRLRYSSAGKHHCVTFGQLKRKKERKNKRENAIFYIAAWFRHSYLLVSMDVWGLDRQIFWRRSRI